MNENKPKKRVTMGDVAKAAGVSKPVVSAILKQSSKNNSRFSKETMDRVVAMVKELNYRPNRTARKFVTKKNSTIGILFSRIGHVGQQLLALVAQWSAMYDFELILERIQPNELPRFFKEDMVDAILMFEKPRPEHELEMERLGIPTVFVNTIGGPENSSHILLDEEGGMRLILDHFCKQGKKNPFVLLPKKFNNRNYYDTLRVDTLQSYSKELGMAPPVILEPEINLTDYEGSKILDITEKAFTAHPELDCVLVDWAYDAICVYDVVKKAGKTIPDDISVACIVGVSSGVAYRLTPQLTHLSINESNLGRTAVLLINDIFSGKSSGNEQIIIPYDITVLES